MVNLGPADSVNRKLKEGEWAAGAGRGIGRGAVMAALTLGLMLVATARGSAAAQEPAPAQNQQQQQDPRSAPAQDSSQQGQPQDQTQAPASPSRPAAAPVAKAKPKYSSQDANKPPYANDRQNPSPYSAPAPDEQGGDQDQEVPPDEQQAPAAPLYRDRNYRNRTQADGYGDRTSNGQARSARPSGPVPASLTILEGTVLSVRVNEFLSSDKNQVDDRVTATLERPIVVNGWVVARRGQTLTGQVTAAVKAGRVKGTSQLGLELTDLTLVDGHSAPILTQIWKGSGGTTHGADAATIGGTTALGAAIGSVADWGRGAAIGAGAGAAAGIAAVLLTRGRPTEILPETPMTFRLSEPVTVDTTQSAQSFAPVTQQDYDGGGRGYRDDRYGRRYAAGYGSYGYPVYGYPYGYPYPYPGYYYSPGVVVYGGGWGWRGRRW
jgi:hypothetical protein